MTCIELKLPVVETLLAVSLYYELVRKQIHSSLYLFRVCNGRSSVTILLSITAEVGMTATVNHILMITLRQIFQSL